MTSTFLVWHLLTSFLLQVPSEFKPTLPTRSWVVSPFLNPMYTCVLAVLPALLATILIFMDQQITAVIVNRKENKLKVELILQSFFLLFKIISKIYSFFNNSNTVKICLVLKLQKGGGYHLDLFVLAILIMVCSVMGLPWFVAATVLSINHVNSLKLESECAAPGEKPQFLGVR